MRATHAIEACVACGSDANLVEDHVVPRRRGGTNDPSNIQLLCWSCNSAKSARPWETFLQRERGWGLGVYPIPQGSGRARSGVVVRGHVIYRDRPRTATGRGCPTRFPRLLLTVRYPELAA